MVKLKRFEKILVNYEDFILHARAQERAILSSNIAYLPEVDEITECLTGRNWDRLEEIHCNLILANPNKSSGAVSWILQQYLDIVMWVKHSHRAYSLSDEFVQMFLGTDLPKFPSGEIKFVANCFVVLLNKPVLIDQHEHDFIVCRIDEKAPSISIRSYPSSFDLYKRIPVSRRRKILSWAATDPSKFDDYFSRLFKKEGSRHTLGFTLPLLNGDVDYPDLIKQSDCGDEYDSWIAMLKIVLGLNLYLQTNRSGDEEKNTKIRQINDFKGKRFPVEKKSVIYGASVTHFSVSGIPASSKVYEGDTGEHEGNVRPHFRCGFWRRPKGYDRNSGVQATIWVRPTWVRKDKIVDGVHPVGTIKRVQ